MHEVTSLTNVEYVEGGPDGIEASALSMIAACFVISSSMRSVFCSVANHRSSPKLVAEPRVLDGNSKSSFNDVLRPTAMAVNNPQMT